MSVGSVAGTKIIRLEGGPPEWDGHVTAVSKTGGGTAERWDHTADLAILYAATDREREVTITRELRNGPKEEQRTAQVYEYCGYKEDL